MALPWFRFYTEWADDPKVQMLSEAHQRRLAMLFCYQGQGWLPNATDEGLSFKLRISLDELAKTRTAFQDSGFIKPGSWNLVNWDKRQAKSDISTARVRKHRMKLDETVSETVLKRNETSNETNETVLEERRGEEIRREQKRLEEKRQDASRGRKHGGGQLAPLVSIFPKLNLHPPLPRNREELIREGYTFSNKRSCSACGEELEWWVSSKGSNLPVMHEGPDAGKVHLGECAAGRKVN